MIKVSFSPKKENHPRISTVLRKSLKCLKKNNFMNVTIFLFLLLLLEVEASQFLDQRNDGQVLSSITKKKYISLPFFISFFNPSFSRHQSMTSSPQWTPPFHFFCFLSFLLTLFDKQKTSENRERFFFSFAYSHKK